MGMLVSKEVALCGGQSPGLEKPGMNPQPCPVAVRAEKERARPGASVLSPLRWSWWQRFTQWVHVHRTPDGAPGSHAAARAPFLTTPGTGMSRHLLRCQLLLNAWLSGSCTHLFPSKMTNDHLTPKCSRGSLVCIQIGLPITSTLISLLSRKAHCWTS